jgi:AcrR family transcriptional regulator
LILDGALPALARRGIRKFSMSDVCAEAGVSRGTLYRYFRNKQEVLDGISSHVVASLTAVLRDAAAAEPASHDRLRLVLQTMFDYPKRYPELAMIIRSEPGFALDLFTRAMPQLADEAARALTPALESRPGITQVVSPKELAEIAERLVLSMYLMPSTDGDLHPARLSAAWQSLVTDHLHMAVVTSAPR